MKTKFYWVALLASAALIAQAQAGGHYGGGGGGGGHFAAGHPGPARGGAVSSFHSMPMRNFGGGRMIYSGQRFSSVGMRSPSSAAFVSITSIRMDPLLAGRVNSRLEIAIAPINSRDSKQCAFRARRESFRARQWSD